MENDKIISEINITPLTDVFMVLLVIFMVATPMLIQSSIKVNLPRTTTAEETASTNLIVTITATNHIYLNDKKVESLNKLEEDIREKVNNSSISLVIINADKSVYHGKVIDVLDTVKKAGALKIAIGIEKKQ